MITTKSLLLYNPIRPGLILLVIVLFGTLTGCTSAPVKQAQQPPADDIYAEGRKALQAKDYPLASSHFKSLEIYYPDSPYNHQAQMELAYAYFKSADYSSAIATTDRLIRNYPNNDNHDYPRYLKALAAFEQAVMQIESNTDRDATILAAQTAIQYFDELSIHFPNSKYQQDANKRVAYLQEQLAQYEVAMARKMIETGNHASAIVHARNVVENYPHTRSAADALAIVDMGYEIMSIDNADADSAADIATSPPVSIPAAISNTVPMVTRSAQTQDSEPDTAATMAATTTSNAESVDLSESNPAGTHSSAWIKRQPADHYTIQLVSTVEKETLNPFIRHHKLDDRVAYYRKNINGKTWHALIYGVYSSTAEARAAVSELPDELSNNKPWIQKIQTIQQAIDDFSNGS